MIGTSWYVILVERSVTYFDSTLAYVGTATGSVTKMSTFWPAAMRPPSARSSGTLMATARHAGEFGPIVSSGLRTVTVPFAVVDANIVDVTGWPGRIAMAAMCPTAADGSV